MPELLPLNEIHIPAVARLHADALAGDFLPSLGESFLRAFYRSALSSDLAFGFVEMDEAGELAGFVLGSPDTSALFRSILRRSSLSLAGSALPAVLRRPGLLLKVAETFLYPSREDAIASQPAELLVIAVTAGKRSRGLGDRLVQVLNQPFSARGIHTYKVTVLQSNHRANAFYQRLGFQPCGQFMLYGKGWNVYHYQLAKDEEKLGNQEAKNPGI